jgi:hypothetical protein
MKKYFIYVFASVLLVSCGGESTEEGTEGSEESTEEVSPEMELASKTNFNFGMISYDTWRGKFGDTKEVPSGFEPL